MARTTQTVEATAPAYWASYLINDDSSGMDDEDLAEANAMVSDIAKETGRAYCIDCSESNFKWHPDYGMAGDVCVYTFDV